MTPLRSACGASPPGGHHQRPGKAGSAAAAWNAAAALETLFVRIAAERMHGVPILHPDLHVQAVGFEAEPDGAAALGVLITPWFMNLVRVPMAADTPMAGAGENAVRAVGRERFAFIGAEEPGFGAYEACSLFSPMFEFTDQEAAVATAAAVLAQLRQDETGAATTSLDPAVAMPADPARRAWLLGRPREEGAG